MNILSQTSLVGHWIHEDGRVRPDETCRRIEELISGPLERCARSPDGWSTLYRDPSDGRLWLHYFPHSEGHGGGPPALRVMPPEEARTVFGIDA
jgi:hypothetical protein